MATQTIEFRAAPSQTVTLRLFVVGSDTQVASATATEATNRKGTYAAAFTSVAAGEYQFVATIGTSPMIPLASGYVRLTLTTATFQTYDAAKAVNLNEVPSVDAGAVADAVWDEPYNQHTTAGTFGKLMDILRKSNTVIEGTILASPTPTTTTFKISGADYPTGALEHSVLWMSSGNANEQNSPILTTTNNGDGTLTIVLEEALTVAPIAGDTVLIDPTSHVHSIASITSGVWSALTSGLNVDGSTGAVVKALASMLEFVSGIWRWKTSSLSQAPTSGGGGGPVLPLSGYAPDRGDDVSLKVYYGEKITQILFAYEADGTTPVDLSGKTLEIVVERYSGDDVDIIPNEDITVTGEDGNEVRFNYTHAISMLLGTRNWALRDADDTETVYLKGTIEVLKAARNNAHNS